MGRLDWFQKAANSAMGVGRAALDRFTAPASPDTEAVSKIASRNTPRPTNPLTKTSAFRTMGEPKKPTFKGFTKTVGAGTLDGLNLVNSGLSAAQGDYEATPGQVVGDAGSVARLARMNSGIAARGGAPLKLAADPRSTMIAYGAEMVAPHVKEAFNPAANKARYNANVQEALNPPPATYWEKLLGLEYNPSQGYKDKVAQTGQLSPNSFVSTTSTGRKPMEGAKQLGGGQTSRQTIDKQLGEIFDFALQRGIDPAYEYMGHVMRRDGLTEEQGIDLYNKFMNKLYRQQAFDKAVNQPLISDPKQLARYREVF